MYLKIQGLVLRVTPYNDTDALLTVLTQDQGKLTLKARGLRRKNSPITAPCQLLAYGEFTLFAYKGMYTINEAHSLELFQPLHRDLLKLSLGTYFAQVADVISQEDIPNPELLSLLLNSLYALSNLKTSQSLIKAVFELRSTCLAGYEPTLAGCARCGNTYPELFDISQGRLECHKCRSLDSAGIRLPIFPGILDAMRYICTCDPKRLFAFELGTDALDALSSITESYLSTQLERGFSALDFYKSIQNPLESF